MNKKAFLWLALSSKNLSLRKVKAETQSKNPETGTDAEAMKKYYLLDCSYDLLTLLSYKIQTHMVRVDVD